MNYASSAARTPKREADQADFSGVRNFGTPSGWVMRRTGPSCALSIDRLATGPSGPLACLQIAGCSCWTQLVACRSPFVTPLRTRDRDLCNPDHRVPPPDMSGSPLFCAFVGSSPARPCRRLPALTCPRDPTLLCKCYAPVLWRCVPGRRRGPGFQPDACDERGEL